MDYIAENQRFSSLFMAANKDWNKLFVVEMLETYKGFEGLTCLVDVGGGDGSILNAIISKYPSIKGINFDLPSKIEKAPSYPGLSPHPYQLYPTNEPYLTRYLMQGSSMLQEI